MDELVSTDPETGVLWSNREIGRRCTVDHKTVAQLRGGTVYPMKPRGSGSKPARPEPAVSKPGGVAILLSGPGYRRPGLRR